MLANTSQLKIHTHTQKKMLVWELTLPTFYSGNLMPSGELLKGCNRRTTNLRPPLAVRSCQKKSGEKEEGTEEREREEKGRTEYKKQPASSPLHGYISQLSAYMTSGHNTCSLYITLSPLQTWASVCVWGEGRTCVHVCL